MTTHTRTKTKPPISNKVKAGAAVSAVITAIVAVLYAFGIDVPAATVAPVTGALAAIISYRTPDA